MIDASQGCDRNADIQDDGNDLEELEGYVARCSELGVARQAIPPLMRS